MRLITQRQLIREVATRWAEQYENDQYAGTDKGVILQKLRTLNLETASANEVNAIIGNDSWTESFCNECKRFVADVIEVGEESDYESATANLCQPCWDKAHELWTKVSA